MIANPHDMYLPGLESVSYPPKKINTVAVKVTRENIGALSIEFETELFYGRPSGDPFFNLDAARPTADNPDRFVTIQVNLDDWLVVLWDEYRVFRENEFAHTFRLNAVPSHELVVDHSSGELPEFLAESASPELQAFNSRLDEISKKQ